MQDRPESSVERTDEGDIGYIDSAPTIRPLRNIVKVAFARMFVASTLQHCRTDCKDTRKVPEQRTLSRCADRAAGIRNGANLTRTMTRGAERWCGKKGRIFRVRRFQLRLCERWCTSGPCLPIRGPCNDPRAHIFRDSSPEEPLCGRAALLRLESRRDVLFREQTSSRICIL